MSDSAIPISSLRAWYGASLAEFLACEDDQILGRLTSNSDFAVLPTQRDAWITQIRVLRDQASGLAGGVFLEFNIPRMGRRVDVILVVGPVVFALEFKVGEHRFDRAAIDQVWDYALDLKNFHEASHDVAIVPILVVTENLERPEPRIEMDTDRVFRPILCHSEGLRAAMAAALNIVFGSPLDHQTWALASYRPTPTIIEAARALYARHSVEAIARFDAGAQNLHRTSRRIEELVEDARVEKRKIICFVTGVPGAGKTLVGLNVATQRRDTDPLSHAVFLSGNGPLVAVLREALTRDEFTRRKQKGEKIRKGHIAESVKAFIQNVHHFRDDGLIDPGPPSEHVVIFDEAQRAWNQRQTANFMRRKKGQKDFTQSEPEFLISYMDRHSDWAVIVCLVGGGQEINTGEAGIAAWLEAVHQRFGHWQMFVSSRLTDSEYAAGLALEMVRRSGNHCLDDSLHLAVSMRSFRAENVSAFVKALLDGERVSAQQAFTQFAASYPLALTRDLEVAKKWIQAHARGSERYGLVASSRSLRLKPHAIDIRVSIDPVHYFLNAREDTRSSY